YIFFFFFFIIFFLFIFFFFFFFFFNDTATTEIYTLSLHDALPIFADRVRARRERVGHRGHNLAGERDDQRSEEHTSELQSREKNVCRLLLEKKKKRSFDHYFGTISGERGFGETEGNAA